MDSCLINQSLTLPLIFFGIALSLRALFSFLETSITALRLFKLRELAKTYERYETLFESLEQNPHRVLITILICNSLADVTTAALATNIMEVVFKRFHLSSGLGFSAGIALATIAILIFGEIIPKNLAKGRSESLFRSTLWLVNIIFYLFYPIVTFLNRFTEFIITKLGGRQTEAASEWISSEREIQFLIDYIYGKGVIEEEKSEMLQNIFELGRTPVKEIMVPETDIIMVPSTISIKEALSLFADYRFTRLPVYEEKTDNIIGMVHLKDILMLLSKNEEKQLKELIRPILFIPESIKVNQLLREFKAQHMHIAMVINEHGSITGLITLEDVLEEIVGELRDELETIREKIIHLQQGGWLIDASTPLEDLVDLLHITFETEGSVTLGGFLTEQLQHLPKKGERILYKKHYFQVQKASHKRVLQVLVFPEHTNGIIDDTTKLDE
jgi:CBS domain containing-hemolysin-like protein